MIHNIKESKIFYIVLSILVAIVLWAYVVNVENPDIDWTVSDIPVTFVGENALAEENLMVMSGKASTISLRLQGKRQTLTQLNRNNITITVDLSKLVTTGLHQMAYEIHLPSNLTLGENVSIVDRSSNYVDVTLGRMVTKTIAVTASFEGNIADGYIGDEMTVSPETVEISGEEQEIAEVDRAEVIVTGQDLSETLSADMPYQLLDYSGNEVLSKEIQKSTETVHVTLPVVVVKNVPLEVSLKEGGGAKEGNAKVVIEPASIMLSGEETDLLGLESITVGEIDLAQVLSSSEVNFTIPLPPDVKNVSGVTEAKVSLELTGLTSYTGDRHQCDKCSERSEGFSGDEKFAGGFAGNGRSDFRDFIVPFARRCGFIGAWPGKRKLYSPGKGRFEWICRRRRGGRVYNSRLPEKLTRCLVM